MIWSRITFLLYTSLMSFSRWKKMKWRLRLKDKNARLTCLVGQRFWTMLTTPGKKWNRIGCSLGLIQRWICRICRIHFIRDKRWTNYKLNLENLGRFVYPSSFKSIRSCASSRYLFDKYSFTSDEGYKQEVEHSYPKGEFKIMVKVINGPLNSK